MDFNRVIYLSTIQQSGESVELTDLWNDLTDICLIVPDFKLKQSNFYTIIGSLENQKMIVSKSERKDWRGLPSKSVSITPAGSKFLEGYFSLFPRLLPKQLLPEQGEGSKPSTIKGAGRKHIDLEQDEIAELQESIVVMISNELFQLEKVDEKKRAKIESIALMILAKVQKYF